MDYRKFLRLLRNFELREACLYASDARITGSIYVMKKTWYMIAFVLVFEAFYLRAHHAEGLHCFGLLDRDVLKLSMLCFKNLFVPTFDGLKWLFQRIADAYVLPFEILMGEPVRQ